MIEIAEAPIKIDEKIFRQIYVRYWQQVYAVCYHNLEDAETAKSMVQDIFKAMWERREELEITVSVERYLLRSAKFKVFEYLRNRTIRERHLSRMTAGEPVSVNSTENEVYYNYLKERVAYLVEGLPRQCRNVFKMSREQGLSNKEIASSLLISERAVEYHITRALATLKSDLSEYFS